MPKHTFHFLNVSDGDCSIIEHGSGNVSVIDVCNARRPQNRRVLSLLETYALAKSAEESARAAGRKNYNQKASPENPIEYLHRFGIISVFRFVLTHPDMDHMDGIKDLFDEFGPPNFYDTDNSKEIEGDWESGKFREADWEFYKKLRDGRPQQNPKRLTVFSGDRGIHRTIDWNGKPPGDAFYVLAPTPELVAEANETGDYNDCSYVILYRSCGGRILLAGDSHDKTWEHILAVHAEDVAEVDLLIAPHHGRRSGRSYEFLDTVRPKMTFFGNAPSEHLAYGAWRYRDLDFITNNMAGNLVVECGDMSIYVGNEAFARDESPGTFYSDTYQAWYLKRIGA